MANEDDEIERKVKAVVPPGIALQVLAAKYQRTSATPAIRIMTPAYPTWLARMDPNLDLNSAEAIKESVKAFMSWRKNHHEKMSDLIDGTNGINFYDTGSALIVAISRSGKALYLQPYTIFGAKGRIGAGAATLHDDERLNGTSVGMPHYSPDGKRLPGSGTGEGADSVVIFSPETWDTPEAKKVFTGPGTAKDEILFHEMVHALRLMTGTLHAMPVSQGYEHEEEYLAIVLTNVYMSEKRQTDFRARHTRPNIKLQQPEKFLDNVQGVDLPPIVMIERFRLSNPGFYKAYADIPASSAAFNPVREFRERDRAGKIKRK